MLIVNRRQEREIKIASSAIIKYNFQVQQPGLRSINFVSLFYCKIFSITKYFQMKMISEMIFFPSLVAFQKMFWKIFYNVVRKIEQKGQGVRRAFLENGLQKNWT